MGDDKVLDVKVWPEDGEYGDIIKLLHRSGDIICTASEVTNEQAKRALFDSVKILLADCISAIDSRVTVEPVLEEDDD